MTQIIAYRKDKRWTAAEKMAFIAGMQSRGINNEVLFINGLAQAVRVTAQYDRWVLVAAGPSPEVEKLMANIDVPSRCYVVAMNATLNSLERNYSNFYYAGGAEQLNNSTNYESLRDFDLANTGAWGGDFLNSYSSDLMQVHNNKQEFTVENVENLIKIKDIDPIKFYVTNNLEDVGCATIAAEKKIFLDDALTNANTEFAYLRRKNADWLELLDRQLNPVGLTTERFAKTAGAYSEYAVGLIEFPGQLDRLKNRSANAADTINYFGLL